MDREQFLILSAIAKKNNTTIKDVIDEMNGALPNGINVYDFLDMLLGRY